MAPDIALGVLFGLLAVLPGPLLLIRAAHSATSTMTGATGDRALVWCILAAPIAIYFSIFGAIGAAGAWSDNVNLRSRGGFAGMLFRDAPQPGNVTLLSAMRQGASGGLLGMLVGAIVLVAIAVVTFFIMFVGPGIRMFLFGLGIDIALLLLAAIWGAVIGALLYVRHQFDWPLALVCAAMFTLLTNVLIDHALAA